MDTPNIVGLLIAALGGAAVGLERQWSGHADGPGARFAGIRTFTMLGAVAGFSGWLWTAGSTGPAAILLVGAVALVTAAYVAGSRQDIDGTTEAAALVVLAAGVFAGMGSLKLASGIIALLTLLLVEKSRLHAMVQRIDDVGLRSGVRFAVMALVILPLLPEGPSGPLGGIRPTWRGASSGPAMAISSRASSAGWCRQPTSPSPSRGRAGRTRQRTVRLRWVPLPRMRCSIREYWPPPPFSMPRSHRGSFRIWPRRP
jgi:hypothetical protein